MDLSPGAAIAISLVLAIVLTVCPAASVISFPAGGSAATDLIAGVPGPVINGNSTRLHVLDESFDGKIVHANRGDVLLVQLQETDPAQAWQFSGHNGFKVISDVVQQMHPARHDFRVKITRPGDLRFTKVDRRDGFAIDTFTVHVILDNGKPDDARLSHPLSMISKG